MEGDQNVGAQGSVQEAAAQDGQKRASSARVGKWIILLIALLHLGPPRVGVWAFRYSDRCSLADGTYIININLHADPASMAMALTEQQARGAMGSEQEANSYSAIRDLVYEVADNLNFMIQPLGIQYRINASKTNIEGYEGLEYDRTCQDGDPAQVRTGIANMYFMATKPGGVSHRLIIWACPAFVQPAVTERVGRCGSVSSVMYTTWDLTKVLVERTLISAVTGRSAMSFTLATSREYKRAACDYVNQCIGESPTNIGLYVKTLKAVRHKPKKADKVLGYDEAEVFYRNHDKKERSKVFHLNDFSPQNSSGK